MTPWRTLWFQEDAQAATEYALLLASFVVGLAIAIRLVGMAFAGASASQARALTRSP
jgi:hypothetical protein